MIFATRWAKARTFAAAGPSVPLRDRGSPTTTSIGSYSATIAASLRSAVGTSRPGTVSTGVARMPSGSQDATPIRASPTSTAILGPRRIRLGSAELAPAGGSGGATGPAGPARPLPARGLRPRCSVIDPLSRLLGDEPLHGLDRVRYGGRLLAAA